ncbi:MAG: nucleotidyltransferase domain-containing protein [Chloroflexia bacterium]
MAETRERNLPARLETLRERLGRYLNVLAVFLFGSQVDGYATPHSDIDLAVLFERDPDGKKNWLCPPTSAPGDRPGGPGQPEPGPSPPSPPGRLRTPVYERGAERVSDFIESTVRRYIDDAPDLAAYYRDDDRALG